MKPLTSETLAKAAIIEGYCWEIAALEVANKNTTGAQYFMGLADSLHAMYEVGYDDEKAPRPQERTGRGRIPEDLRRAILQVEEPLGGHATISSGGVGAGPPAMPEMAQTTGGGFHAQLQDNLNRAMQGN